MKTKSIPLTLGGEPQKGLAAIDVPVEKVDNRRLVSCGASVRRILIIRPRKEAAIPCLSLSLPSRRSAARNA